MQVNDPQREAASRDGSEAGEAGYDELVKLHEQAQAQVRALEQNVLALHAELQQRDTTIADLSETTLRLRVRLERILSSPPARLYLALLRQPALQWVQQWRARGYQAALAQRRPGTPLTKGAPSTPSPGAAPRSPRDARRDLAEQFLRGDGIEIGALHLPLATPETARVRYVDRTSLEDLRSHYPELAKRDLSPVDVVDDGERLDRFAAESLDFIIANHFLEHCEDPIRTIETHLGKLRPGGVLFYAVPDKRYSFDFRRPSTPLPHVIGDYEHGPESSRHEHYLEWQRLVIEPDLDPAAPGLVARARALEADRYSIHFHVWTLADLVQLMLHCQERFGSFEVEAVRHQSRENIVLLRKHGTTDAAARPVPDGLDERHRAS